MNAGVQQSVHGREHTVRDLFSRQYGLEYYQREYTWERRHVVELVNDLMSAFLRDWHPGHDRQQYATYRPYFLGPFVCHSAGIKKNLVDGQQRFTTLHLLLIHLEKLLSEQGDADSAHMVGAMVRRYAGGVHHYTIDVDERRVCLEALRSGEEFDTSGQTVSVQNLWLRAQDIAEAIPEELVDDCLATFADWLADRVFLVEITAADRDLGWEIFERMNDRGAGLTSLDLLKSFILSHASQEQAALNAAWRDTVAKLSSHGRQVPSEFFEALLIAKYATIDGSDVTEISRAFHEWVRANPERMGLRLQGKDYSDFVLEVVSPAATQFSSLLDAARIRTQGLEEIFYNASNGIDSQYLLIMAAARSNDTESNFREKARLLAAYMDLLFILRTVNNDTAVQPLHFREEAYRLLPAVRQTSSVDELRELLGHEVSDLPYSFEAVQKFSLHNNRRQVRYLLARLTAFVEVGCGRSDEVDRYLGLRLDPSSEEAVPWEIEHVWANKYSLHVQSGIANEQEFQQARNRLGALLLLEKPDNASFGADRYMDKLPHYHRQNFLAASLHPNTYLRTPAFRKFRKNRGLEEHFSAFPDNFDKQAIESRSALYRRLCELIWSPERIGFSKAVVSTPSRERRLPQRKKTHYGVQVSDLIQVGLVQEGAKIRGGSKRNGFRHEATVISGGRVRIESSGEVFGSLSGAGKAALGGTSCPGWDFWHVEETGGSLIPLKSIRQKAIAQGLLDQG